MITLSDVAKAAGVSPSAVSKALLGGGGKTTRVSEEKVRRIRETAERLGYRPNLMAQRLARKRQDIIGLIVDSQCCHLYSSIMSTIEQQTCRAGYRLQVGLVHDNLDAIKRYVDDLLGYNIQNVICLAHYYDFSTEIPRLFKPFANPLFIGRPMTDEKFSFVSPDYYANFCQAMEYLFSLNRTKTVFVKTVYTTYDMEVRAQAFRDMHRKHGIPFEESQIYCGPVFECNTPELMTLLLDEILPMHPDSLILGSAEATLLAIRMLRGRGIRVPEDISIIGMEAWSGCSAVIPSITVMDNNPHQIAVETINAIIRNMEGRKPEIREIFVRGQLIPGESCCKKPAV